MIIVSMGAGLGNQMFEYAFGYKLHTLFPNQIIKFDVDYAFPYAHNGIEVDKIFGISFEKASYDEVKNLADMKMQGIKEFFWKRLCRYVRRKVGLSKNTYRRQKDFTGYYPDFFQIDDKKDYYFYGPFCNAEYFEDISRDILKIFSFPKIDENNVKWKEIIEKKHCVSIHVRRGDYIANKLTVLKMDYYREAVEYLERETKQKYTYLIFSDDSEFVKKEFDWIQNKYYIDGNIGKDSFRDMQLMSLCEHNIIANSSFSFWGAFLNKNPEKIVISSKTPFDNALNPFTTKGWVAL